MLLFSLNLVFAQKTYNTEIKSARLNLEGKSLSGYSTQFDFDREDVRKGWWEYAREFGSPLNMKTYYKITIPSETTDGNVDLEIFTQTTEIKGGSSFFLGVANKKYDEQAKSMILDFKKNIYIDYYIELITFRIDKSDDLGKQYRDEELERKRAEILKQINQLEEEVEWLKNKIKTIEKSN
ncbi:hypothetical protein SAMN05421640_0562 [Ekhidna lutea]|uniref:Uncharacterized protein n=1 Tax=Ekhidna lutea TaxID=447679 RepID=A0A239FBN7_EKHLU|nr:hypothetical protein SAMN05421640_0562 [Ekhidna lutea]